MPTKEPQYDPFFRWVESPIRTGVIVANSWMYDPKRLSFHFSRYKFVAKMLQGLNNVIEIGCGDGFASRLVAQEVTNLTLTDFDPLFVDEARNFSVPPYEFRVQKHDFVLDGPLEFKDFLGAYCLDVIEHIPEEDEDLFLSNITKTLSNNGVLIVGTPSEYSQVYASEESKAGHVNCKTAEALLGSLEKHFANVFLFSMNDEVVHTGFTKLAHYYFAIAVGPIK